MAYIPREEYVPRRGVAMHVMELPSPKLKRPPHRDELVDAVADHFSHKEFVLNRSLNDAPMHISKVKTFKSGEVLAATGNGNVIAPEPANAVVKRHRGPLDDRELERIYQSPQKALERRNDQILMENSRSVFDHMTQPRAARRHRLPGAFHSDNPPIGVHSDRPVKEVMGFEGLGRHMIDKPEGKGRGRTVEPFDPLGFRRYQAPERIHGVKKTGRALISEVGEVIKHDDHVPLLYKTSPLRAHRFHPAVNFAPEQDIPGFRALGASDEPAKQTKMKTVLNPVDHDYRFVARNLTPITSGSASPQQQQQATQPSPSAASGGFSAANRYPFHNSRTPTV